MEPDILQPAMLGVHLAWKHIGSDDYFQQLLIFDSALEDLLASREEWTNALQYWGEKSTRKAELEVVQQSLGNLDMLIGTFEALQVAARNDFNLRARSLRQHKVGILDLPNELLRNVFENFRGDLKRLAFRTDFDYDTDTVDIQNIRLAHPRFLEHASPLLIRHLDVSPTRSSLKRLENIMRHPTISQGQRLLRLDLRWYCADRATDLMEFAFGCYKKMKRVTRSLQDKIALRKSRDAHITASNSHEWSQHASMRETLSEDGGPEGNLSEDNEYAALKDGELEHMVAKAQCISSSWEPFAKGVAAAEEGAHLDEAALALLRGYERYCELLVEQSELVQSGHFVQAVAAAMASGHSKGQPNLWLYMSDEMGTYSDWNPEKGLADINPKYLADPDLLVQSHMIEPVLWFGIGAHEGEISPQRLLYELPLAMCAAGVALAGLSVRVNSSFIVDLNMSQGELSGLREVAETLDIFELYLEEEHSQVPEYDYSPEDLTGCYAYVSSAMGRQGVPTLSLTLDPAVEPWWFELGPLLTSPSWPGLDVASFTCMTMGIEDLRRLVGMLQPGGCLRLDSIRLTSGTWAEALDCLRSKALRWGSYVDDCRGAECDEFGPDSKEYDSIFSAGLHSRYGDTSQATRYITSEIHKNPLRKDDVANEATEIV